MKKSFAALLCCPSCQGPLDLHADDDPARPDDVASGLLRCPRCSHDWSIRGGIPRFVTSDFYAGNFSLEWTRHRLTQLDSARSSESEETFAQKTGLTPDDLRGKLVLDVGCGMGRFSDVATRWGAEVVGVDLSLAVESAAANLADRPNFNVAQADVFRLPFRPETFDVIFSLGVLHHTPSTVRAFRCLPSLLKPGGRLAIWVYHAYNPLNRISDAYRIITTRLPREWLYTLSKVAGPVYPLYHVPVLRFFLQTLLPVAIHPDRRWRVLDTFDWYSPKYQWKHTYAEVDRWFRREGFEDIRLYDYPVAMSGRKPLAHGRAKAGE